MMTTSADALTIGIVADTDTQQQRLRASAQKLGMATCFCGSPAELYALAALPLAACWLVQLEDEEDEEEHPEDWDRALTDGDTSVLFFPVWAAMEQWSKLLKKLTCSKAVSHQITPEVTHER